MHWLSSCICSGESHNKQIRRVKRNLNKLFDSQRSLKEQNYREGIVFNFLIDPYTSTSDTEEIEGILENKFTGQYRKHFKRENSLQNAFKKYHTNQCEFQREIRELHKHYTSELANTLKLLPGAIKRLRRNAKKFKKKYVTRLTTAERRSIDIAIRKCKR